MNRYVVEVHTWKPYCEFIFFVCYIGQLLMLYMSVFCDIQVNLLCYIGQSFMSYRSAFHVIQVSLLCYIGQLFMLYRSAIHVIQVSFNDIETFNQRLATTILEEYYRVYPYVCSALKIYIQDIGEDIPSSKDVYVSFVDVAAKAKYVLFHLPSLLRLQKALIVTETEALYSIFYLDSGMCIFVRC